MGSTLIPPVCVGRTPSSAAFDLVLDPALFQLTTDCTGGSMPRCAWGRSVSLSPAHPRADFLDIPVVGYRIRFHLGCDFGIARNFPIPSICSLGGSTLRNFVGGKEIL